MKRKTTARSRITQKIARRLADELYIDQEMINIQKEIDLLQDELEEQMRDKIIKLLASNEPSEGL